MTARGKIVLVVDDSSVARRLVKTALEETGCDIVEASNGREAFTIFEGREVALVITDLLMPDTTGLELVDNIRQHVSRSGVPVIVLSSQSAGDLVTQAFALGVKACLKKPFKPAILASAVVSLLAGDGAESAPVLSCVPPDVAVSPTIVAG